MGKFIVLLLLSVVLAQGEESRLEALSQIETGNDDRAVGGAGEVSRYQIKPWIWRQYSDSAAYSDRRISSQVADQHLAELTGIFRKRTRREPTDFDLYVLWNAGPTYYARIGFAKSRVHPVISDRARRYANLRQALDARLAAAAAQSTIAASPLAQARADLPAPKSIGTQATLLPILPSTQTASWQNPMFSLLPLPSQPEAPLAIQPPIFAVGGIQAK
jgi:hypothetical protein